MTKSWFAIKRCLVLLLCAIWLGGCSIKPDDTVSGTGLAEEESTQNGESPGELSGVTVSVEQSSVSDGEAKEKPVFLLENVTYFAYDNLTEAEQVWYREMEQCLGNMEEVTRLDVSVLEEGLGEEDIDRIFQCVMMDHPEFFFVDGYTYTKYLRRDLIVTIEFSGTYNVDRQEALAKKAQIEEAVAPLLAGAEACTSDYERIKYVYETIIVNTEYDLTAPDNQNIYSVFVNHMSVCQGYAKAAQYLLNCMGMECTLVQGRVDTGEGHAWNLVKADGSYYYMDTTWGDASYRMEEDETATEGMPEINYDYLCITTRQLLRTHTLSTPTALPECVDDRNNYYVKENAFFTSYNKEQMQELFDRAADKDPFNISLQCADADCFQTILNAMIEEQDIFHYLKNDYDKVTYTHNEKQLSMTFWVTNI